MPRPSDVKLADALREAGLEGMADRAEAGEFNDYFSQHHATPKMALVKILAESELPAAEAIARRVMVGDFDSDKDEAQEWYKSPEGQAIRDLMDGMT